MVVIQIGKNATYCPARGMHVHTKHSARALPSTAWGEACKMAYGSTEREDLSPIALQRKFTP